MRPPHKPNRTTSLAMAGLWASVAVGAMLVLINYSATPGSDGNATSTWPSVGIDFCGNVPHIVVFLHPRCSCSRASVQEFQKVMARHDSRVHAVAVVRQSKAFEGLLLGTDHLNDLKAVPGLTVLVDHDGSVAEAFGVRTSGHVLLFGSDRRLAFSGGITRSRGHEGPNRGIDLIENILAAIDNDKDVQRCRAVHTASTNAVYGCALSGRTESGVEKVTR